MVGGVARGRQRPERPDASPSRCQGRRHLHRLAGEHRGEIVEAVLVAEDERRPEHPDPGVVVGMGVGEQHAADAAARLGRPRGRARCGRGRRGRGRSPRRASCRRRRCWCPSSVIGPGLWARTRTIAGWPGASTAASSTAPGPCSALSVTASSTASRASSGSRTTMSPAPLSTSRTSHEVPANGISMISAPSASSSTTVRSSRTQRARSGETQTRATRRVGHLADGRAIPARRAGPRRRRGRLEVLAGRLRLLRPVEAEVANARRACGRGSRRTSRPVRGRAGRARSRAR